MFGIGGVPPRRGTRVETANEWQCFIIVLAAESDGKGVGGEGLYL